MNQYIGQGIKRIGASTLLQGHGRFVDDVKLPRMAYLALARSPYSHAEIVSIDTELAKNTSGVIGTLTGEDLKGLMKPFPKYPNMTRLRYHPCYPLATGKVRFQGEPVVAVVAESLSAALDAVDQVSIEYEPLAAIANVDDARKSAVKLYSDWDDNVSFDFEVRAGDIDAAFAEASQIVEGEVKIQRQGASPLECRGYLANYENDTLSVIASTQRPHTLRTFLADLLDIPESKIRVTTGHIGGGFGLKTTPHREEPLVCVLSKVLGRPVKWIETRRENLSASGASREQIHHFEVAVSKEGDVLGIKDKMLVDMGAYFPQPGILQVMPTGEFLTGPYKIRNLLVTGLGLATNKPPFYPYRGFGKESAAVVHERIMDIVSRETGIDRLSVRRRNLIESTMFPYETAAGFTYDSGDYETLLRKVIDLIDYDGFNEIRRSQPSRKLGFGLALFVKPSALASPNSYAQGIEVATVRIDLSGRPTIVTGLASIGTGSDTALVQIVASEIGVNIEDVEIVQGDTLTSPYSLGTFGSRSVILAGSAAKEASRELKQKLIIVASDMMHIPVKDLDIEDGRVASRNSRGDSVTIADLAKKILKDPFRLPKGVEPSLEATHYFYPPNISNTPDENGHMNLYHTYSSGAVAATVEVSPENGSVDVLKLGVIDDCGRIINPALARGQVIGALAQGVGSALYEEMVYDNDAQPMNSTFIDYILPATTEMPPIDFQFHETPSPFNPLGAKGVGEIGLVGVQPAILSAVNDAISSFGIEISSYPLTPEKIWRAITKH